MVGVAAFGVVGGPAAVGAAAGGAAAVGPCGVDFGAGAPHCGGRTAVSSVFLLCRWLRPGAIEIPEQKVNVWLGLATPVMLGARKDHVVLECRRVSVGLNPLSVAQAVASAVTQSS